MAATPHPVARASNQLPNFTVRDVGLSSIEDGLRLVIGMPLNLQT